MIHSTAKWFKPRNHNAQPNKNQIKRAKKKNRRKYIALI